MDRGFDVADDPGIVAAVDAVLADTVHTQRVHWSGVDADLADAFAEIERLVFGGGKRLRPRFCHWGWVAAGGDPASSQQVRLGAAIELLHVAALLHDDVIDDAATRRGSPTAHRRFGDIHAEQGWAGESRRFGEGVAILAGDLTFVMADMLVDGVSNEGRSLWHELRLEVNVGQYLDMSAGARRERRLEVAERICRYKSAKYTVERPLHLGAFAADEAVGARLAPMFTAYGLPLGDAFQMRDDMLGAFGDPKVTGKPVGGDFREGKPTPLLAHAWSMATEPQRRVLDLVGRVDLGDDDVAEIQQVVIDTGAVDTMEKRIASLRDEAIAALDPTRMSGDAHRALVEMAVTVTSRNV